MDTNTFSLLLNAALATKEDASAISLAITIQIVSGVLTIVGMLFTYLKAKGADDGTKESNSKLEKAAVDRKEIKDAVNGDKAELEAKASSLRQKVVDLTKELAVTNEQKIAAEKTLMLATVPSSPVSDDLILRIIAAIRSSDKQEKLQ